MAVHFFSGFEFDDPVEANLTAGGAPILSLTAGAPTCETQWAHRDPETGWGGDMSTHMVETDQWCIVQSGLLTANGDEIGFAVKFDLAGYMNVSFTVGGVANCAVRLDPSTGFVTLYRGSAGMGTLLATSAAVLTVGTVYWVQVTVTAKEAASAGRLQVKIDGAIVIDTGAGGTDCRATTTDGWDTAVLTAGAGADLWLDDLVYASTGTITGDLYAIRRAPSSDFSVQGTPSTGTSNYAMVDEPTLDTADYIDFDSAEIDLYGFTSLPGTPTSVLATRTCSAARVTGTVSHSHLLTENAVTTTTNAGTTTTGGTPIFVHTFVAGDFDQVGVRFDSPSGGTGRMGWLGVESLTTGGTLFGAPLEADEQPPYRALIVPDPRFTVDAIWAAESSYSAVGPRPGVPVDQGDVRSRMVLQATGTQAAGATTTIFAGRAGYPDAGAAFAFDDPGFYGWDPPAMITGFEWVNYRLNASTDLRAQQPHVIRLQNGNLLAAARVSGGGLSVNEYAPGAFGLDGATGTWSYLATIASELLGATFTLTQMTSPCLLQLPSGRVLCFFWRLISSTKAQIGMHYSDDDGNTWAQGSQNVLDVPVEDFTNTSYSRLRAAYSNGQILLIGCPDDPGDGLYLIQWASDDDGATFTTVWTQDHAAANHCYPEIVADPAGGFDVYYVELTGEDVEHKPIASAFESLGDATVTTISLPSQVDRDLALWETEDGTLFFVAPDSNANGALGGGNIFVMASRDRGTTWFQVGNPTDNVVNGGLWMISDNEARLENFAIAECRGRSYMLTEIVQPSSTSDLYSILCLCLGGHVDITHPTFDEYPTGNLERGAGPVGWRLTYAGFFNPTNANDVPTWTATTGGAATGALTSTGWQVTASGGADRLSYSANSTLLGGTNVDDTLVAMADLRVLSGGATTSADCALRMRSADGTDEYTAEIRMTTTGYRVWDPNAGGLGGAQVGSDQVVDMDNADGVQVYLVISEGGEVQTMHRVYSDGASMPLRDFTLGVTGTLASDTVSPAATRLLQWGSIDAGATATSVWRLVCFTSVPFVSGLSSGIWLPQTNGGIKRKFCRPLSARPVTLPSGVSIRAIDGPCLYLDEWTITTRYEHPIDNLFTPSPRQTFESAQMGPTVLAWEMDAEGEGTTLTSTSIGLALLNTNVRFFTLSAYDGSWTTIATVVNGHRNLKYIRSGNAIVVDNSAASPAGIPWFTLGSTVGAYAVLDDGSFLPATEYPRRIIGNSSGRWSEDAGKRVTLLLDPDEVDGTEPTSGDLSIVYKDVVVLIHDVSLIDSYSGWRISIPDQDYPPSDDDKVRIGSMVFGPIVAFGRQYSATRALETIPNAEVTTRRSGSRIARELGPARRSVEISWLEGIDESQLWYAGTTSPDTIVATTLVGSRPIAAPADTALLVAGLVGQIGPVTPVVYLPRVPVEEGNNGNAVFRTAYLPNTFLYARIVNSARTEVVMGDELESEVTRVISLVLEEEI